MQFFLADVLSNANVGLCFVQFCISPTNDFCVCVCVRVCGCVCVCGKMFY